MSRATEGLLPATRFAVDAYVNFVRDRSRARGGRLVADRDVLADDHRRARRPACWPNYDWITRGHAGLFHAAADPGAEGRRLRARLRRRARAHARRAGAGAGGAAVQMRRAVGAARRAALRLCRAGPDPAGRLRAGRRDRERPPRRRARASAAASSSASTRRGRPGSCWRRSGCSCPTSRRSRSCKLVDGARSVGGDRRRRWPPAIDAPRDVIAGDVAAMLRGPRRQGSDPAVTTRLDAAAGAAGRADASLPAALPLLLQPARAGARQRRSWTPRPGCACWTRRRRSACCRCISPAASRLRAARSARARARTRRERGLYSNLITSGVTLDDGVAGGAGRGRARPRAAQLPGRRAGVGRPHRRLSRRARAEAGGRRGWSARPGCR